jgi:hypothetical protein
MKNVALSLLLAASRLPSWSLDWNLATLTMRYEVAAGRASNRESSVSHLP